MAYSEDHIALAAEYALGTLDADERAQVESMIAVDEEFEAIVQAWGFRLGVLNQMVGAVEPRPELWDRIKTAIIETEPPSAIAPPETPPPLTAEAALGESDVAPVTAMVDESNVIRLSLRARRWRNVAAAMTALAAVLVAMIAVQVYKPERGHACLRCLWPDAVADGVVGNCAEAGVLGPVPGAVGTLQALMTLKILLGLSGQLAGELLLLDFTNFSSLKIKAPRRAECRAPGCAHIREIAGEDPQIEIALRSLADAAQRGLDVIDIRTQKEFAQRPTAARHIAMPVLLADPGLLAPGREFLLVCASGKRSLAAARELRKLGLAVRSLAGGLQALDA